jgi:hypothetical protein
MEEDEPVPTCSLRCTALMGIPFESARLRRRTALVVAGAFAFTFGGCSRVATIAPPPESSVPPLVLAQRYADTAAELPAGVDAAFAVARDEIGAESYSGALLGADGAYQNRGANSVDRAQLLAHLLAAKNIPLRDASRRLDATAAEALATQLFVAPRVPMSAAPAAKISGDDSAYVRIRDRGERDFAGGWWEIARDVSSVRAVFEDLNRAFRMVQKPPAAPSRAGVWGVKAEAPKPKVYEITRPRGGPSSFEYAVVLTAILLASLATLYAIQLAVEYVILTVIPELEK